jgi:quercetin dioxygenase-like cupin family protein
MTTADEHFSTEAVGSPGADGRFVDVSGIRPVELVPGLVFQPVLGERTMVNFVHFAPHTEAPRHVHEEEQIVIVLEGEFDFELDGDVRTVRPGDVVVIPPWVPHGARTQDRECYEVDVFNPPRKTLLEHASAERERARSASPPGGHGSAGSDGGAG